MSVIAYFDESGDDGTVNYSSETFILSSLYMQDSDWIENYNKLKSFRKSLKDRFGIPLKEEFHTAHFFKDKDSYRKYNLSDSDRYTIIMVYANVIASLNAKVVNTIIDKKNITTHDYPVLKNSLTYTIQRIENDSSWKYIVISDKGRISIMKKTARAIRNFNPIISHFDSTYYNNPIKNMIEDILEKDSKESYFIQVCDFISYVINLYYKYVLKKQEMPKRISSWLKLEDIEKIMEILKNVYNTQASSSNEYDLVIYPKLWQKKGTTLPSFEDGVVQ